MIKLFSIGLPGHDRQIRDGSLPILSQSVHKHRKNFVNIWGIGANVRIPYSLAPPTQARRPRLLPPGEGVCPTPGQTQSDSLRKFQNLYHPKNHEYDGEINETWDN